MNCICCGVDVVKPVCTECYYKEQDYGNKMYDKVEKLERTIAKLRKHTNITINIINFFI